MRALLIDPTARTVTEVEFSGGYKAVYPLIDCELFDVVAYDDDHSIYVDDEGLLKGEADFWQLPDRQPIAGKGLLVGFDDMGADRAATVSVEELTARLRWLGTLDEDDAARPQPGVGPLAFDSADEPEVLAGRLLAAAIAAGFDPQAAGRLAACVFLAANRHQDRRVDPRGGRRGRRADPRVQGGDGLHGRAPSQQAARLQLRRNNRKCSAFALTGGPSAAPSVPSSAPVAGRRSFKTSLRGPSSRSDRHRLDTIPQGRNCQLVGSRVALSQKLVS
jgi:hypothetical protein